MALLRCSAWSCGSMKRRSLRQWRSVAASSVLDSRLRKKRKSEQGLGFRAVLAATPPAWKAANEMIGVSVPRKAQSVLLKFQHLQSGTTNGFLVLLVLEEPELIKFTDNLRIHLYDWLRLRRWLLLHLHHPTFQLEKKMMRSKRGRSMCKPNSPTYNGLCIIWKLFSFNLLLVFGNFIVHMSEVIAMI
ncbi:hypothetical protein HanIR_Chr13g0622851 [Helianthus annuus]|nr:hypothetical protein HanIR_Chr13g0622851 [Helianthus annuus]